MDDVVIVGGGRIGAATAYFLSKEGRKVKVIERDPTYKTASFPLSLGGFRRQFFQKENILCIPKKTILQVVLKIICMK